ncbi:MAG TPA: DUF4349 domain-containing protein [Puia sp.]|jgi:hypothetical protein|nr:DUF4349 domain-containing protein [Puia sp.]
MKKILSVTITVLVFTCMFSCNRSQKVNDMDLGHIDMAEKEGISPEKPVADSVIRELGERRFIRTADLKFKVSKVEDAVIDIENKARALGGFVNLSRLKNIIQDSTNISISQDSSLQTIHYVTEGFLILRVPDYRLDSLLTILNPLSTLTLNREIRADDVRIQMLTNNLSNQRAIRTSHRMEHDIDSKGKKLSDIEEAEKTREEREESADNAKISNLTLDDAVRFSTISIEIYQDPGIRYARIVRDRRINEYQSPFISQVSDSFESGWQLLKDLIIALTRFWSVFVLCILAYFVFIKYFQVMKKIKTEG